jgi:hypothetical protein
MDSHQKSAGHSQAERSRENLTTIARSHFVSEWILVWISLGALALTAFAEFRRAPLIRLEYVVITHQPLLSVPTEATVAAIVEGRTVTGATITVLRIANSGRATLPATDWESSLEIDVPSGTLISARQVAAKPVGFRPKISLAGDKVEVAPFLFNPGDIFDIQLICEEMSTLPVLHARIKGVKSISRRRPVYNPGNGPEGELDRSNKIAYFVVFPVLWMVLVSILVVGSVRGEGAQLLPLSWFAFVMAVSYAVFLRLAVKNNRRWRPEERV